MKAAIPEEKRKMAGTDYLIRLINAGYIDEIEKELRIQNFLLVENKAQINNSKGKHEADFLSNDQVGINNLGKKGLGPMHVAAANGDVVILKLLLQCQSANCDFPDVNGWTVLIHCINGCADSQAVRAIINHRTCNINATDPDGNTALHWASKLNKVEAIRLILNKKADPHLKNYLEETALECAVRSGNEEAAEEIISLLGSEMINKKLSDNRNILHLLVEQKSVNLANTILSDPNFDITLCLDDDGNTPLHIAARLELVGFCNKLIEHGFDMNQKNSEGKSPADLTKEKEFKKQQNLERKIQEKQEKTTLRKQANESSSKLTEVGHFCRDYFLPAHISMCLYTNKYRDIDEDFFSLEEGDLRRFGLPKDDRELLLRSINQYEKDHRDRKREDELRQKREIKRKQWLNRILGFFVLVGVFLLVYVGLQVVIIKRK